MEVKKFNISKPRTYTVNGEEKKAWDTVGTITEFHKEDGKVSRKVEIPAIGLDAQAFPFEARNNKAAAAAPVAPINTTEDIDVDSIPF